MIAPAAVTTRIAASHPTWAPAKQRVSFQLTRLRQLVAVESIILSLICLLDLCSTLFWVAYRDAAEANPLMAFYLKNHGVTGFILAKCVFMAMPLMIAEWARRHNPRFVHKALRLAIFAYLTLYLLGVSQINGGAMVAARAIGIHTPATDVAPDDTGYIDPTESK